MDIDIEKRFYDGPFDLLLKLIDKNKIDICDISLSDITEEYLMEVEILKEQDPENITEFILLASTLLEIKSRKLLPINEFLNNEEEIEENVLINQIIEYRKLKKLAEELKNLQSNSALCFSKLQEDLSLYSNDLVNDIIIKDSNILLEGILKVMEKVDKREENLIKFESIKPEEYSIEKYMEDILILLKKNNRLDFNSLIDKDSCKQEVIVVFLSVLELLKNKIINVFQNDLFSKIIIELR